MPQDSFETQNHPVIDHRVGKLEIAHAELARDLHHMSLALIKIAEGQEALVAAVNQMANDRAYLERLHERMDAQEEKLDVVTEAVRHNTMVTRVGSGVAGVLVTAVLTAGVRGWFG